MSTYFFHVLFHASLFIVVLMITGPVFAQEKSETVATAAQKAFDAGAKELESGNHTGAITLLKTAVRIQPQNAEYHHRLSRAFLAAQQYHSMWVHLRKASVLGMGNETYARDFLKMWKYHDLAGKLNVGTPAAEVAKALGEPDKKIETKSMKRWAYGFMAIDFAQGQNNELGIFRVIDLRGYTAVMAEEVEQVSVKTDASQWKVAHHQVSRLDDNLELTRNDEQIQQWTELFSKQRFPLMSRTGATIDGMIESIKKSLKMTDPHVEFNLVKQSDSEAHYHWITHSTDGNPAQHEVAKIMKGKKDFYRVAYVKKTERLSPKELAQWNDVIGNAKLIPLPNVASKGALAHGAPAQGAPANTRLQAWSLGKSLSLAALIRGKHGPEDSVKSILLDVSRNAQALGINVPPPAKLTDDASADTATAIQYLLDTAGKPIYGTLSKEHGIQHAALFELATKSCLLMMLYQPGESTGQAIGSAIEKAGKKAQLDQSICKPLLETIAEGADGPNLRKAVREFQTRMTQELTKTDG